MKRTGPTASVLVLALILSVTAAGGWADPAGGSDCIPGMQVTATVTPCASLSLAPWQVELLQPGEPPQGQSLPPAGGTVIFTITEPDAGEAITFRFKRTSDPGWEIFTAVVSVCPSPLLADPWEFDDGSLRGGGDCHSRVSGPHAVTLRR